MIFTQISFNSISKIFHHQTEIFIFQRNLPVEFQEFLQTVNTYKYLKYIFEY